MNLNEDTFSNLRDKVADIKYDTQQVLDRIDSLDAAYQEMTGMEKSLLKRQKEDAVTITQLKHDVTAKEVQASAWKAEVDKLKEEREMLEKNVKYLRDENERLKREKEASSGPCGCQAYRDLESKLDNARLDKVCAPTNPVIPKAVAIAIFREGVQHGVANACDELDNDAGITIEETGYTGDFEVSFSRWIDLSDHLDLDWMRDKCGDYDEASVIEALKNLCADDEVKFTIEGLKEQSPNAD